MPYTLKKTTGAPITVKVFEDLHYEVALEGDTEPPIVFEANRKTFKGACSWAKNIFWMTHEPGTIWVEVK